MRKRKNENEFKNNVDEIINLLFKNFDYKEVQKEKFKSYVDAINKVKNLCDDDIVKNIITFNRELPLPYEVALYCCGCDYDSVANYLRGLNYYVIRDKSFTFSNKATAYVLRKFCSIYAKKNIAVMVYEKYMLEQFLKFSLPSILKSFYQDVVVAGKIEERDFYGIEPNYIDGKPFLIDYDTRERTYLPREIEDEEEN